MRFSCNKSCKLWKLGKPPPLVKRIGLDHREAGTGNEEVVETMEREGLAPLAGSMHDLGPFESLPTRLRLRKSSSGSVRCVCPLFPTMGSFGRIGACL
ncbi:hypothetical protein Hanom_Chr13g01211231 [Helianthus anomalus]